MMSHFPFTRSEAIAPSAKGSSKRRVWISSVACAVGAASFGIWLGSPDHAWTGGLVGAVVGAVCGTLDPVFDAAVAWAAGRTQRRFTAGVAGAVSAMVVFGGMMLIILGGVGFVGGCWG